MSEIICLQDQKILQSRMVNILYSLLKPLNITLEAIIAELENVKFESIEILDEVLSVVIRYNRKNISILRKIGNAYCTTDKFSMIITTQQINDDCSLVSFDFIYAQFVSLQEHNNYLEFATLECSCLSKQKLYDLEDFFIEPLTNRRLQESQDLIDNIFPEQERKEKILLQASLNKQKFVKVLHDNELSNLQYWIAIDKDKSRVIGITGIYTEITDSKEKCWLGWFGIDQRYRGYGYAKKLLDFSILQARLMDKKVLHVYTYNSKKYEIAINLYKKYGFIQYEELETKYKKDLYFKKIFNKKDKNVTRYS